MSEPLSGLVAAVHTPFLADGRLNLAAVEKQAHHMIASGIRTIFVGGSTGEAHSLTVTERLALTRRWMAVTDGSSLRVVVHVGHNCQSDAIALAQQAAQIGACAIAALSPSYFKPANVAELIDFLAPVAAAAPGLPFYFYDIPGMTGVCLGMVQFLEQAPARIPTLAGLKYTSFDLVQFLEVLRFGGGRFNILYGHDEALLAATALGARGAVGSTYNFAAAISQRLLAAHARGDWASARDEQARSIQLIRLLASFGYLPACKHVMTMLGADCGPARPPLGQLSEQDKSALARQLEETGLWEAMRT